MAAFVFGQRSDEERCFHALYHTTLSITFREFALATTERYIDEQGKWEFFGTLAIDRTIHTATILKDGTVLVVGGGTVDGA